MAAVLLHPRIRVGATSFVFPAGWAENVRRLAGRVDDVEVLVFERTGPSGPTPAEIEELAGVGRAKGLTFSVHAPLDLALASEDASAREASIAEVLRVAALTRPLAPHALVVHLDGPPPGGPVHGWRRRAASSLGAIVEGGVAAQLLCLENLGGGFGPAEPLVEELGLSVALDVGHLARDGVPFDDLLARHLGRTRIIHWHGCEPGARDHRSLRHYPAAAAVRLLRALDGAGWRGVITVEVFREADLTDSLEVLAGWVGDAAGGAAGTPRRSVSEAVGSGAVAEDR